MLLAFPAADRLVLVLVVALEARVLVAAPVDRVQGPALVVALLVVPVDLLVPVDTRLPVQVAAPSRVRRYPVRVCPVAVPAVAPEVPVAAVLAAAVVVPVVVVRARISVSRVASVVVLSKSSSPAASLVTRSRRRPFPRVKSSSSVGSARRSWAPN